MSTLLYPIAPPPKLQTLHTKPSWHNRAGNIDRSACFTLNASQLWRHIPDDQWAYRYPARQPAYQAKGKCDRYANQQLWARDLWLMHKWEQPYPLQGDFRSAKSNVMRAHTPRTDPTYRKQAQRNDSVLGNGPINPNRGVGFSHHKMLGLDCMWSTTLRIERYVQHHQLKQHFLVCPVCAPQNGNPQHPKPKTKSLPPGRVTRLYLPLCTERELEDARLAQLWLKTHLHPNRPLPPIAVQLIERYSELFDTSGTGGRPLRCQQCLGLRYGEVKSQQPAHATRFQTSIRKYQSSIRTEQSLFLNNLPKLLAPVPDASPTQRRRAVASDQSSIKNHQLSIKDLPQPIRDQLLHLLAGSMPAFKKLEKVKQLKK